jgi:cytochrome b561
MKDILKQNLAKQIVHWLLMAVVVVYFITGFGITEYRIVESLTLGLLTKPLAFKIHNNLWIPLVILLVMHIYQRVRKPA